MKYFTRERYIAMQNSDEEAVHQSDQDWETAVESYDAYLLSIRPGLSEHLRQLLDGFYLHDATVLSMGQRGERFVITLRLDVPPNEILTIVYHLDGTPEPRQDRFPWRADNDVTLFWLYEELEMVSDGDNRRYVHRILFDNGWEIELRFHDVELSTIDPLFPAPKQARDRSPMATSF